MLKTKLNSGVSRKTELEIIIKDEIFKILIKIIKLQLMIFLQITIRQPTELKFLIRKLICFSQVYSLEQSWIRLTKIQLKNLRTFFHPQTLTNVSLIEI